MSDQARNQSERFMSGKERMSRRRFVIGGIGGIGTLAGMGALLAACAPKEAGSDASASASATASQGPWTFTDDRGVEVSLPSAPARLVAYETAASALWYRDIDSVVAIFGSPSLTESPLLEGVDVSGVESLGEVYAEINLEKLTALQPDLIVTAYNPDFPEDLWGTSGVAQQQKMEKIAPIVVIDGVRDPTEVISRYAELAQSLGADQNAPDLVDVGTSFDQAVADLKAAVAAKPGLQVLAIGAYDTSQIYFAKWEDFPALRQFKQWGVEMVDVRGSDAYWDIVSFEQADKYPADLIMHDVRTGALGPQVLADQPTWRALPAVQADQLVGWQGQEDWSYQLYVKDIESLTAAIEAADPNVVS